MHKKKVADNAAIAAQQAREAALVVAPASGGWLAHTSGRRSLGVRARAELEMR